MSVSNLVGACFAFVCVGVSRTLDHHSRHRGSGAAARRTRPPSPLTSPPGRIEVESVNKPLTSCKCDSKQFVMG
eukprot:COSAG05_NODE_13794_length_418_cov_0.611285_1_plen_73_part_10